VVDKVTPEQFGFALSVSLHQGFMLISSSEARTIGPLVAAVRRHCRLVVMW